MSASIAPAETTTGAGRESETPPGPTAFSWRVFSLLNVFRLTIAGLLLVSFFAIRESRIVGDLDPAVAVSVLASMLLFAVLDQPLLNRRWPNLLAQIYVQFTFDLVTIVLLMHASGGIVSGVGGLLVVSIGTLALVVPLDRALLLASLTTFALLGEQALSSYRGITASTDYAATGILAAVIFVITGIVQLLRKQIVETEALAERRGVDLQNLVELNEFIIRHLRESIVVVDDENRIRLLNESAAGMLGVREKADNRTLGELAPTLAARLRRWREGGEETAELSMVIEDDSNATRLLPHFARLGDDRHGGVVIFLEDTSLIVERVQQTKLAALGRLSASIAHEIRNPLGALSHAGQLLAESDGLTPDDQRLTEIIRINSGRVSRIVESVLALSKGDKTKPERIQLKAWARDFAEEFTKTQELFEGAVALTEDSTEHEIEIDRTHLHQVVWNLCDNAVKYASATAGAIAVELRCGALESSGRPFLDVIDSGPGVSPDMIEQIFEPFYTAQPGGTGLGLYISRELCERNGASLRYQSRAEGGSTFRIVFADPERWGRR